MVSANRFLDLMFPWKPLQLKHETLPDIPCTHPCRVQGLQHRHGFLQHRLWDSGTAQILQVLRLQVPLGVQIFRQVAAQGQ